MGSADARLSAALRHGEDPARILRDALATGRLAPGYTTAREVRCEECGPWGDLKRSREVCWTCDTTEPTGWTSADPLDLLRLAAFCGLEAARELVDWSSPRYVWDTWAEGLSALAAKLPPKRVAAECAACEGTTRAIRVPGPGAGSLWAGPGTCTDCYGSSAASHHDTHAEHFLLTVAALAAAEECLPHLGYQHERSRRDAERALAACRAWIADPTPQVQQVWIDQDPTYWDVGWATWLPSSSVVTRSQAPRIDACADVIGAERVREVACAAILAAPLLEVER